MKKLKTKSTGPKKKPPFNENAAIRGSIRRTFSRSPVVWEVLREGRREIPKYNKDGNRAKKNSVQYSCQTCGTWTSSKDIVVDHVKPVISVDVGFVDWNTFVARLFCVKENLNRICSTCHNKKTNAERFERNYLKDKEALSLFESKLNSGIVLSDQEVDALKITIKKFTAKKLLTYPTDFVDRVTRLKLVVSGRTLAKKKNPRR